MLIILFPLSSSLLLEVWFLDQPVGISWELFLNLFLSHEISRDSPYSLRSWLIFWMQLALTES